jgi:hypothetical protein
LEEDWVITHQTSWSAGYSFGSDFAGACQKITVVERANNNLSSAEHVFLIKDARSTSIKFNEIADLLIKQADQPFSFWIESPGGKTKEWHHVIARMKLSYSQNDDYNPRLVVTTIEQLAHSNRFVKSRAHKSGGVVSDLVRSILGENSLVADSIAPSKVVPEFETLRQCYMTDYQFIITHLIPRANAEMGSSGYRLFTKDGLRTCFQPLNYNAVDCTLEFENILKIEETIDCYDVLRRGGHNIESETLDPFTKKVLLGYSEGEDGSTGDTKPSWLYPSYLTYPMQSQEALDAITRSHQRGISGESYPLTIKLIGNRVIGKEALIPEFPLRIKLPAGSNFRSRDDQSGFLEEAFHFYDTGVYEITLRCSRGSINTD